jgi:hypothetical protein
MLLQAMAYVRVGNHLHTNNICFYLNTNLEAERYLVYQTSTATDITSNSSTTKICFELYETALKDARQRDEDSQPTNTVSTILRRASSAISSKSKKHPVVKCECGDRQARWNILVIQRQIAEGGINEEHGEVALLEVRRLLLDYADVRCAVLDS